MAGELHIKAGIDSSEVESGIKRINRSIRSTAQTAVEQNDRITSSFRKLGAVLGVSFGVAQLKNFTSQLINVRGEFQKIEMAFQTMLGNKAEADKLMAQVVDTAAKTPFDLQGVANGAKQLLAYGVEAKDVNETLVRLGDIAAGLGQPLGRLTYLYGSTKTQGRLYSQDLMQFTNAGIPMVGELAKQFGVAESEVKKLVSEGKVGFEEVQKVIENLTNEGGKFGGLMEKQSQTLSGQIANLEDAFSQMLNNIGKESEGLLSGGIKVVSTLVENYKEVGYALVSLVATYGAYKAALATVSIAEKLRYQSTLISMAGMTRQQAVVQLLTAKWKVLNQTLKANLFGIIAAAVVALIAVIYRLVTAQTAYEKLQEKLNESVATFEGQVASETRELDRLKGRLSALEKGTKEYNEVRDEIISKYGKYYDGLKQELDTVGLTEKAYRALTTAIRETAAARALDAFNKQQDENLTQQISEQYTKLQEKLYDKYGDELGAKYFTQLRGWIEQGKLLLNDYGLIDFKTDNEKERQEFQNLLRQFYKDFPRYGVNNILGVKDILKTFENDTKIRQEAETRFGANENTNNLTEEERLKKEQEKAEKAMKEYKQLLLTQYEDLRKAIEDAEKAESELRKRLSKDKIREIEITLADELKAIDKAQKEYVQKQKDKGIDEKDIDVSGYNRQKAAARKKANLDKKDYQQSLQERLDDVAIDDDIFAQKQAVELLKQQFSFTSDLTEKLALQQDIRDKELAVETKLLETERHKALLQTNNKDERAVINKEYDQKIAQATAKSQQASDRESLNLRLEAYERYAEKVIEIEQWKNDKIQSINDNETLTKDEKQTALTEVDTIAGINTESAWSEILGDITPEELGTSMAEILNVYLNTSLETLKTQIPILERELARLKKTSTDPKKIAKATMELVAAQKALGQISQTTGAKTTKNTEELKERFAKAADALGLVEVAAREVQSTFGDMLSESGQDALAVMNTVTNTAISLMTNTAFVAMASGEAIKTVERASVILAIIGAVLQVLSAIASAVMKHLSTHAKLQAQIDESKEHVEDLKETYNDLERVVNKSASRDYYQGQIELCKNLTLQQAEYNRQLRLSEEQYQKATTGKKRDEAQENIDEAKKNLNDVKDQRDDLLKEFYNELIGTDLKGFSENLAESIVEGFEEGISDIGSVWDKAFDDMMKGMLKKQIAMSLEKNLQKTFSTIQSAFGDGDQSLSNAEINRIQAEYDAARATSQKQLEEYQRLFDKMGLADDPEQQAGKQGFAAMSQDTADELNGRFTAIQISTANINLGVEELKRINTAMFAAAQSAALNIETLSNIADLQLMSLREIADNTAALKETNLRLRKIEENTSKL